MDKDGKTSEQNFSGMEFQFFLYTDTPGAARYYSYKPHCRDSRQGLPDGNQGRVPEYILDTPHYMQGQWPYY